MPYAIAEDGIRLYYEETGTGRPLIFVHEFAGDLRSWEPQLRRFGRRYRCVAFNARGYPPSDVPESPSAYSQSRAADDIRAVLDHLAIDRGHIVGLSMGGFATLHFGFRHPDRALSLCVAGCGYGAEPAQQGLFREEAKATAEFIESAQMRAFAEKYSYGPARVQFENKDPRGFAEFKRMLAEHSALGSANTQLGVQREPFAIRAGRGHAPPDRSDAGPGRRSGLALPPAGHPHEAEYPVGSVLAPAELRAHDKS